MPYYPSRENWKIKNIPYEYFIFYYFSFSLFLTIALANGL